jgi:hypothetical protein
MEMAPATKSALAIIFKRMGFFSVLAMQSTHFSLPSYCALSAHHALMPIKWRQGCLF